jgi:hypothetical protein
MPPETHTRLRNFRCDDPRWSAFLAACEAEGTTASEQIRDMIDVWLEGRD